MNKPVFNFSTQDTPAGSVSTLRVDQQSTTFLVPVAALTISGMPAILSMIKPMSDGSNPSARVSSVLSATIEDFRSIVT